MSVKILKLSAQGLIGFAAVAAFCGPVGVAAANDAPVELLLQNTGVNAENAKDFSGAARAQTDREMKKSRYALPDGTRIILAGGDINQVRQIKKITVTYANKGTGFEQSVSDLKILLGEPVTGRGDILIWKTKNVDAPKDQSQEMTIIAGTHGKNKYAISVNRRAKQTDRNNWRSTSQSERRQDRTEVRTKRKNERAEPERSKRDIVEF